MAEILKTVSFRKNCRCLNFLLNSYLRNMKYVEDVLYRNVECRMRKGVWDGEYMSYNMSQMMSWNFYMGVYLVFSL